MQNPYYFLYKESRSLLLLWAVYQWCFISDELNSLKFGLAIVRKSRKNTLKLIHDNTRSLLKSYVSFVCKTRNEWIARGLLRAKMLQKRIYIHPVSKQLIYCQHKLCLIKSVTKQRRPNAKSKWLQNNAHLLSVQSTRIMPIISRC